MYKRIGSQWTMPLSEDCMLDFKVSRDCNGIILEGTVQKPTISIMAYLKMRVWGHHTQPLKVILWCTKCIGGQQTLSPSTDCTLDPTKRLFIGSRIVVNLKKCFWWFSLRLSQEAMHTILYHLASTTSIYYTYVTSFLKIRTKSNI